MDDAKLDFIHKIRQMADDPEAAKLASEASSGGKKHANKLKEMWGEMPKANRADIATEARRHALRNKSSLGRSLKAIPLIGAGIGALSALSSGDLLAATPIGEATSTGPAQGSSDAIIGGMGGSDADRERVALEARRRVLEELARDGQLVGQPSRPLGVDGEPISYEKMMKLPELIRGN